MNIDVTRFVANDNFDMFDFAHSQFEHGACGDAGQATWQAALDAYSAVRFVNNRNRDEFEAFFGDFGAWSREELASMSLRELNALFLQFVASAHREATADDFDPETQGGSLYEGDNGRWYYYVGG